MYASSVKCSSVKSMSDVLLSMLMLRPHSPSDLLSETPSFGSDALYGAITVALFYNVYSERKALSDEADDIDGPSSK